MTNQLLGAAAWALAAALLPVALLLVRPSAEDPARYLFDARLFYWTMPVVVAATALAWTWRWRRAVTTGRAALHRWWPGLLLACGATALVFFFVPPSMRVQFDETSLVNVSQNMHEHRAASMTTAAVPFEGTLGRLENTIDKRPPLFAFLVSIVHDLTGPRIANAFAVNALLLATALFLAFAAVRARLGLAAALAAPLLLLTVPLTTIVATSAGFDLLATVLLGITILAARDFVQSPDTVRFVAFVATGVLFAQSRYESLLAFVLIAAIAAWHTWGRWRPDRLAKLVLAACPVLVVPLFLLLQIARSPNFYPEAAGKPLVAWQHGSEHIGPLVEGWFAPSFANPLPGVVAFVAVGAWVLWLVRRRASSRDLFVVAPVFALTIVVLFWFSGDVRDGINLRLYLPLAFFTALSPLLLPAALGPRIVPWLLAFASLLAALRVHEVQRGAAFPRLDGAKLMDAIETAIDRPGVDARTTLWVTLAAQHLATLGIASLSPEAFVRRRRDVQELIANDHLRAIFVITTPLDDAFAPAYGDPRQLLNSSSTLVEHIDGAMPITVHRLR